MVSGATTVGGGALVNRARTAPWTAREQKQYRLRKQRGESLLVDATGTRRRIRALMALGWTSAAMTAYIPTSDRNIARLTYMERVNVRSAAAVKRMYDELSHRPGPSIITARRSQARGWLEPGWWDEDTIEDPNHVPLTQERQRRHHWELDPVAVERAVRGQQVTLTRAERLEAIRVLERNKVNHVEMARRLRVAPRQVLRDLSEMAAA